MEKELKERVASEHSIWNTRRRDAERETITMSVEPWVHSAVSHFGRVSASTSRARRNSQGEEKSKEMALKEVNESSGAHEVFRFRH
jgi:hypothetical protein